MVVNKINWLCDPGSVRTISGQIWTPLGYSGLSDESIPQLYDRAITLRSEVRVARLSGHLISKRANELVRLSVDPVIARCMPSSVSPAPPDPDEISSPLLRRLPRRARRSCWALGLLETLMMLDASRAVSRSSTKRGRDALGVLLVLQWAIAAQTSTEQALLRRFYVRFAPRARRWPGRHVSAGNSRR